MDKISVIVPCFNEEKALPLFYKELNRISEEEFKDSEFEIIKMDNLYQVLDYDRIDASTVSLLSDYAKKNINTENELQNKEEDKPGYTDFLPFTFENFSAIMNPNYPKEGFL